MKPHICVTLVKCIFCHEEPAQFTFSQTIHGVSKMKLCTSLKRCGQCHMFFLDTENKLEFNVPFQHKYGYIREKRSGREAIPNQ